MAIESRRQTSAGDAPLCLVEARRHSRARVNPNQVWQHDKPASLQGVEAMPPVLPGPEGAQSLVFPRSPGLGCEAESQAEEPAQVVTCARPWSRQSQ